MATNFAPLRYHGPTTLVLGAALLLGARALADRPLDVAITPVDPPPPMDSALPSSSSAPAGAGAGAATTTSVAADLDNFSDFADLSLESMLKEPVVTTGGRRAQKISTSLSTITIITREEIDAYPYLFLGDLLATVPGVDVRWGQMQRLYVGMRGLGGTALNSRVLLLRDGLPLNDPMTGELSAGHFVPLVDIERIEVIRGPGSSVYGANAYSGVVNIITRAAAAGRNGLRAQALYGSFNSGRVQARVDQVVGPVELQGAIEAFTTAGPFPVQTIEGGTPVRVKNDDAHHVAASAAATWGGLRVSGYTVAGERGLPGQFITDENGAIRPCASCHTTQSHYGMGAKYPSTTHSCGGCHLQPHDREAKVKAGAIATYDRKLGNFQFGMSAYHNEWHAAYQLFLDRDLLQHANATEMETRQRSSGCEVHLSHALGEHNVVVVGGEGRRLEAASSMLRTPDGKQTAESHAVALFFEDEVRIVPWMSLTGGGRIDVDRDFGLQMSPRVGIAVLPLDQASVRLSMSRAFRNPNFAERFVEEKKGKYQVSGNPELRPESILAYEARAMYTLTDPIVLRLGAAAYYNESRDLIGFRATSATTASFDNVDRARALGTELELSSEVLHDPKITFWANYAYQRLRDEHEAPLPYAPEHKANAALGVQKGPVSGLLRLRYVGQRLDNMGILLGDATTVDGSLSAAIFGGFGARLWITNLTDLEYQESLGIPAARRGCHVVLYYEH